MKEGQPSVIYLKDYQVPDFLIDKTILRFEIHDDQTRVISQLSMRRNPEAASMTADLVLNGGPGLTTQAISIDDRTLLNNEYRITDEHLTLQRRCKRGEGVEPVSWLDDTTQPESQHQCQPRQYDQE